MLRSDGLPDPPLRDPPPPGVLLDVVICKSIDLFCFVFIGSFVVPFIQLLSINEASVQLFHQLFN